MLQGTPAPIDPNRQTTREVKVIEIELGRHSVSKKVKPIKPSTTQTSDPESAPQETNLNGAQESVQEPVESKISTYTVQKNDTLEKIAARPEIYGDGKKWYKIYKANKDTLKGPNNIYPGQIIKIPRD
jgi:nucleoid-associated protein YgaU